MGTSLTVRRAYIIGLILLLLTAAVLWLYGRSRDIELPVGNLKNLPLRINDWGGEEILVSDRDKRLLGTENVLLRRYRKGGYTVNLYVLECASNRASFHPPEYCYVGGRTEMVEKGFRMIRWEGESIKAHRFLFMGPRGRSLVYYWYTFGDRIISSYYRQQLHVISSNILGYPKSALMVRISVDGSFLIEIGDQIIADFAGELMPLIEEYINLSASGANVKK
jgi:EpsI family protein